MKKRIYLSSPHMSDLGYERMYVNKAFDTNWIAPLGENVEQFEKSIAKYVNIENAVALSSGTASIHMALKALGIGKGDIVFCQSLTFIASVNPVIYQNATPVFIDSEYQSYNMCPKSLEKAFKKYPNCKAVIVVHLYGTPANMDEILEICNKHNVAVIEDACESLGSMYKNKYTGTFGKFGTFSFNGNKIITTGGGGTIVTNDNERAEKIRFWITQAKEKTLHYEHLEVGYNYRMSNVLAGIGIGQLQVLEDRIKKKKQIYEMYKNNLECIGKMQEIPKDTNPNYWLSAIYLDKKLNIEPIKIINKLSDNNIEARPIWKPMHMQPVFKTNDFISIHKKSIAEDIYLRGICLPSDTKITKEEQMQVIKLVKEEI